MPLSKSETVGCLCHGAFTMPGPSTSIFVLIDDKHIPVYRIMWLSDVPHFCGNDDCTCEGDYEVRPGQDESVWASRQERDNALKAVEAWYNGEQKDRDWEEEP